jgi:colanic acid biosynthesis glycosyl transferase WcaI
MQILFVSHYFYPEVGAPQTRILETAGRLSDRGHQVTVLTGFPNYPDGVIPAAYRGHVLLREQVGDIRVIRSAVYPTPNRGFARRLINHASFALSSMLAAPLAGRPDVIVAETPPLFTAVAAALLARARRIPLVLNVADLWPESAVQLGALSDRRAIRLAEALERFAYRHSAAITVPTAGMRTSLLSRGEPAEKVVHLPNAVDTGRFTVSAPRDSGRCRIIYCGTVGIAQGVGTLIDAAAELAKGPSDFELLIVGDGAEREELARTAAERGLTNVRFEGRVARERVPNLLASADVAVLCLRDVPLFEDALPTKMLEYMAAGRPVVASAVGDAARLLERSGAGLACPPEDPGALAARIREISRDPIGAQAMGANGSRYVRAHFSRETFVDCLEEILRRLAGDEGERARVRSVYRAYAESPARRRAWNAENPGNQQIISALYEGVRAALIDAENFPRDGRIFLDVGCGHGDLLGWLKEREASADCLIGVDLLANRVAAARDRVADVRFEVADARELPVASGSVSAVMLSTVLSSVLAREVRGRIADEAMRVVRSDGMILCYDVRYANPRNRSVRRVGRTELTRLFPGARIETRSLTLLPPLARRLKGATDALYGPLARLPPLRTHLLAVVRPQ